jgi:hypothetical protein
VERGLRNADLARTIDDQRLLVVNARWSRAWASGFSDRDREPRRGTADGRRRPQELQRQLQKRRTRIRRILNGETAGYGNDNGKGFWNGS